MVPVDANHLRQALQHMRLKRGLVRLHVGYELALKYHRPCIRRSPRSHSPTKQHAQLIAGIRKRRLVRIMRPTNEVESRLFDHRHIAPRARVRHRIAPARVVLMHVGPWK